MVGTEVMWWRFRGEGTRHTCSVRPGANRVNTGVSVVGDGVVLHGEMGTGAGSGAGACDI